MDFKLGQWTASFLLYRYSNVPQFRKGVHDPSQEKKTYSQAK